MNNCKTTPKSKIDKLFGERPQVLESIIKARKERNLSYTEIAKVLSSDPEISVSDTSVKNWLDKKGIL